MDNFLVEPQNNDRAGMTWETRHDWRLAGGYTEFARFAVVHHKTTRLPVEPQNRGRRLDEKGRSDCLGQSNCLGGAV
jgi:hypothetical protein